MKICTTCGSNHADDVDFCPYDGTPLFASASMDDGLPDPDFHEPAPAQAGNKRLDSAQFPEVEPLVFAQPQPRVAPRLDSAEFPEAEPTLSVNRMPAVALADEPAPEPPKPAIRQPRAVPVPPPELSPERHAGPQAHDDADDADPDAVTPPPMPAVSPPKPSEPSVLDLLGDPVPVEDEGLDGLSGDEPLSLDDGLKDRVAPPPEAPPAPPAGSRKLLVGLVVGLVVLAALGAVGYFVVLPMLQQAP